MDELVFEADYISEDTHVELDFRGLYKALDAARVKDRLKFMQYVIDCINLSKEEHLKLSISVYEINTFYFVFEADDISISKSMISLIYYNNPIVWAHNGIAHIEVSITVGECESDDDGIL